MPRSVSLLDRSAFIAALTQINGASGVIVDDCDLAPFLTDWRGRAQGLAVAAVLPSTTTAVSKTVALCRAHRVAVTPQGGNTGLCEAAVPSADGNTIVLSMKRLNAIREIDCSGSTLTVEAGAVLTDIHSAAHDIDRIFPLHLGSEGSAQIGGLISTNAGGTGALRYGTMRDLVLGLEVVLPDGAVWNGLSTLRKNNTGYDLKHLFIGAEGTLGVITAASLKLFPALKARADAWLAVENPTAALKLLTIAREEFGPDLQAFELLSRSQVEAVLEHVPARRCPFSEVPGWSVMMELGSPAAHTPLTSRLEATLEGALTSGVVRDGMIAQSGSDANEIWAFRHSVSEANRHAGHGITLDISVPVSAAADFIAAADDACTALYPDARPFVVCHLGDGNVHYIPVFGAAWWRTQSNTGDLQHEVLRTFHDIALAHGGSFSAEHGVGRKLRDELERLTPFPERELFGALKEALDPAGTMNPGALLADGEKPSSPTPKHS